MDALDISYTLRNRKFVALLLHTILRNVKIKYKSETARKLAVFCIILNFKFHYKSVKNKLTRHQNLFYA